MFPSKNQENLENQGNQENLENLENQWVPVGTSVPGLPKRPRPNQQCYLHLWFWFILRQKFCIWALDIAKAVHIWYLVPNTGNGRFADFHWGVDNIVVAPQCHLGTICDSVEWFSNNSFVFGNFSKIWTMPSAWSLLCNWTSCCDGKPLIGEVETPSFGGVYNYRCKTTLTINYINLSQFPAARF